MAGKDYQKKFDQEIERFKKEIAQIRTGRATVTLLDNVMVEAYGTKTPLPQLSTVTVADARSLVVSPWDKSIIKEIEKALVESDLGLSVKNDGQVLRAVLPQLTEENRQKLVKVLKEKAEKSRIALRLIRDEAKEEIKKQEADKEITEDDKFRLLEELDETIKEYNKKIEELTEAKEKEIMTV